MKTNKRIIATLAFVGTTVLSTGNVFAATQGPNQPATQTSASRSVQGTQSSGVSPGAVAQPQSTYINSTEWTKSYQDIFGITIATQNANTEWTSNLSSNLSKVKVWQSNSVTSGSQSNISNSWNYFYSGVGQSNESVEFKTGFPIPWGQLTVSDWTSDIVTTVYPNGSSSAS